MGTKFLAHKMSQNMYSRTGSQLSKCTSSCWRWRSLPRKFWCFWYDELLE